MASTQVIRVKGSIPSKFVSRKKLKSRQGAFGYYRPNHFAFIPGDPELKIEDFMMYNEPEEEEQHDPSEDEESPETNDGNRFMGLGGYSQHSTQFNTSQSRKSFNQKYIPVSYNFVDYVLKRDQGLSRLETQKVNIEYGTRHLLTTGMFKEHPIGLNRVNKVFCSQWLSDHQIVMGTRCNKLLVYDINNHNIDIIPSLLSSEPARNPDHQSGIHAVEINYSKTLLATGAQNSRDLAVYKLPTLDPVCVGEKAHSEWILDITWLDNEFLVSGSTDGKLALWRIEEKMEPDDVEKETIPNYSHIQPVKVKKCFGADKVRALIFNENLNEIVALSMNAYVHIWDSNRFWQKMSRKLPHAMDNACLTKREDCSLYAIGSKSHFTLLDPRTLHHVKKVNARVSGCSVRSISFHKDILTIGTGIGVIMVYDMRAGKYMESTMNSGRAVVLKSTKGWVNPDEAYHDLIRNIEHTPAIYSHCYDWSGTRLFTAGGPLDDQLKGNYAALWC
ncbi:DDB1- and CUL4-associated factor 12 [Armadillidium nasatum]|uniref:DDB1-and CUL4-associated factor 12 n=2 Tax=Armadillidium nasatum TaxID=96803 RepID=A0A5N5SWL5_9CRUS|nr:DDB1- and CUL4-associated factor 12 [Armadillidium nasatum]